MQGKALMQDIYAQSAGDAQADVAAFVQDYLKEEKTLGYVKPYVPVVQEPVVKKIWVPDQKAKDADILVAGHWVYMMVQGPKWFNEQDPPNPQIPIIVPSK